MVGQSKSGGSVESMWTRLQHDRRELRGQGGLGRIPRRVSDGDLRMDGIDPTFLKWGTVLAVPQRLIGDPWDDFG